MEMCQYILERDLPSRASEAELACVSALCLQHKTAQLGKSAKESIAKWDVHEAQLRGAIIRHIRDGKKVFHKIKDYRTGELIKDDVQANVTLSEGFDIYVEIWLADETLIVIYAHDHRTGEPRLPQ